jgi:hypothetical protein
MARSYGHESLAAKDMNMGPALEGVPKQQLVQTLGHGRLYACCSYIDSLESKVSDVLQLFAVMSLKRPINPFTNPNPMHSHLTYDNLYLSFLLSHPNHCSQVSLETKIIIFHEVTS